MTNTGTVNTLRELVDTLKEFLVSNYNGTVPWKIVENHIDTTHVVFHPFGITIMIPNGNFPAFVSIDWETLTPSSYAVSDGTGYLYNTDWDRTVTCKFGNTEKSYTDTWVRRTIFKDSGEYLLFNMHIKHDIGLYNCEQGGSSIEYETYRDIPPDDAYNLLPLHSRRDAPCAKADIFYSPKRFPGMGGCALTISNENKGDSQYKYIEYWMTKTDRSATVTIRINKKYYQSVTFGFLDHADERVYHYPLYIGGGTQALAQDVYTYTPVTGGCQQHKYGNVFSSDIKNKAFVNGNILNICKFNGANCTNFRVRRPSGVWDNYNNFTQTAKRTDFYECRCSGSGQCYEPQFTYDIEPPRLDTSSTAMIYPRDIGFNMGEVRTTAIYDDLIYEYKNKLDQYVNIPTNVYATHLVPPIKRKMDVSTPMFPIMPYLKHHIENYGMKDIASANGIMGQVPGQYAIWDKSDRHGEIKLSNREYLLVPAGYASRLISYPLMNGIINWFPKEEEINSWYDAIYNDDNMIYSTLAIDLTIDIDLTFLLNYIVLEDGNGNSFSLYNNRLYYLNNLKDNKNYFYMYDNVVSISKKELLPSGSMSIIFKSNDGYIITMQEIDGEGFGKDNIKVVSKIKEGV